MSNVHNANQTKIVCEALRQTELRIEDLQALATVAETRAFQFSASCVLIATLGLALAQTALSPIAVYISAAGLILAAFWALWSAMPRSFHIRGHYWRDWEGHVSDDDKLTFVLITQAKENDDRIDFNFKKLEKSAFHFKWSLVVAVVSIGVFAIGQIIALFKCG